MLKDRIHFWTLWLRRVVTQPRSELTRWQRAARYGYDLGRYGAKQLREDKAQQMAGAMTFRTLFGLLPVLVVGTVLIRAFRGSAQLHDWLSVQLDGLLVEMQDTTARGQSMKEWILDIVSQAQEINLAAIGWIGMIVLIYSAVALMVNIENSFNTIYRAPAGRAWIRRVPMYWTVITLSPLVIITTGYANSTFEMWIEGVSTWQWLLRIAPALWGFVVMWLLIFAVYRLVPNTTVAVRPALVGAFVTSVLLEIGRFSLGAYFQNMLSIELLYGSLGLVPLFMFWVYVMWWVVLFGLEVSALLQTLGGRRLEEMERQTAPTGLIDPASTVTVMELLAERFATGDSATCREIAETVQIPEQTVVMMVDHLAKAGLVHRLDRGDGAVALARMPEHICADELVEIGFSLVQTGAGGRQSKMVDRLRDAQRRLAAGATLQSLSGPLEGSLESG